MRYKSTLKKLVDEIEEYEWLLDVYVDSEEGLRPETRVLILHDESEDDLDEDGEPVYPASNGYSYFMSIHQITSVIDNLADGGGDLGTYSIIEALLYYYDNDAFMY